MIETTPTARPLNVREATVIAYTAGQLKKLASKNDLTAQERDDLFEIHDTVADMLRARGVTLGPKYERARARVNGGNR